VLLQSMCCYLSFIQRCMHKLSFLIHLLDLDEDTSCVIGLMMNLQWKFIRINNDNYKKSWQPSTYCRINVKSTCTQYAVLNCAEYCMPPLCLPFLVTMEIPITYTSAMHTMGTLTLSLIRLLTLNSRELNQGPQLVYCSLIGRHSITLAK